MFPQLPTYTNGLTGLLPQVCSDYDGTRSSVQAANNGLDIAMPGPPSRPDFFGQMLWGQLKARGARMALPG